jgi:MFS family permease
MEKNQETKSEASNETSNLLPKDNEGVNNLSSISLESQEGDAHKNKMQYLQSIIDKCGFEFFHYLIILSIGMIFFNQGTLEYELNFIYKKLDEFLDLSYSRKGLLTSSFFVGSIIGVSLTNLVYYFFGRKWPIITLTLILTIFSLVFILFENLYWMAFCRFMSGVSIEMAICLLMPILTEISPSHLREYAMASTLVFYRVGIIFYVVFYHVILQGSENESNVRNFWRYSIILCCMTTVFGFIVTFISMNDSPRALMATNQFDEGLKVLKKMTCASKIQIDDERLRLELELYQAENNMNNKNSNSTFLDLFNKRNILVLIPTSIIIFCGLFNKIGNLYALPQMVDSSDPNLWLSVVFQQIMAIIGVLLMSWAVSFKSFGRKLGLATCFFTLACLSLLTFFLKSGIEIISPLMNMFVGGCHVVAKIYVTEVFHTKIRVAAYSVVIFCGLIGKLVAPLLLDWIKIYISYGPFLLIAITSGIGGISSLILPYETSGILIDTY